MSTVDYENMSDEEFAKLDNPGGSSAQAPVEEEEENIETPPMFSESEGETLEETLSSPVAEEEEEASADLGDAAVEDDSTNAGSADLGDGASVEDHTTPKQTEAKPEPKTEVKDEPKPEAAPEAAPAAAGDGETAEGLPGSEEVSLSPEEAYKKIMAPFKANGKEFTPKDPDEVIRLMQQGVGYVKKMQALRPNLRMMRMLENKGLLDEEKLNFLIDLSDRNPAAIQKLLHDSKIDPMDIDTTEAPKYVPTNHSVSEAQFAFQETLTDLMSSSSGQETVQTINQQWDKASKEKVFEDPQILSLIHEQRENGIYDRITSELERQKILGNFADTPFIFAYKAVGDYLHQRGELIPQASTQAPQAGSPAVAATARPMVETRTAAPKAKLANSDRALAASTTRSTPSSGSKSYDLFSMTDEEIMALELPQFV